MEGTVLAALRFSPAVAELPLLLLEAEAGAEASFFQPVSEEFLWQQEKRGRAGVFNSEGSVQGVHLRG